jgi:hypothetical protein
MNTAPPCHPRRILAEAAGWLIAKLVAGELDDHHHRGSAALCRSLADGFRDNAERAIEQCRFTAEVEEPRAYFPMVAVARLP